MSGSWKMLKKKKIKGKMEENKKIRKEVQNFPLFGYSWKVKVKNTGNSFPFCYPWKSQGKME